eukprot:scaffold17217_cov30-Tisochrysis_lutea.AAC.1
MSMPEKDNKVALITGVTGQDGSYLAELLLEKGYVVHGIKRRASSYNHPRLEHILHPACLTLQGHPNASNFQLHYGDLLDFHSLVALLSIIRPSEVYNLAAQSHVLISFQTPEYTTQSSGVGVLNVLEAIRAANLTHSTKFYQASTSELFGKVDEIPQSETTAFHPRSPYAVSKLDAYGMFACNGILFNHESPRRGEIFVTRKITMAVARILLHQQDCLFLGKTATVRQFTELAFSRAGLPIRWQGTGLDEVASILDGPRSGDVVVRVSSRYFRPAEVDILLGDPSKARSALGVLGWNPRSTSLESLVDEM